MSYEAIILERQGHVAVITLNRPEVLNALNTTLRRDIFAACEEARADDEVRAVVITGAGRGFCAGADLSGGAAPNPDSEAGPARDELLEEFGWVGIQALTVYRRLDKPTIAAVNGPAAGAGMSLALACDMRVGSENTRFKTTFLERSLSGDSGMTYFLPRIVGYSRACDLLFTSRFVEGEEAHRIGLLDRLVPADRLLPEAIGLAEQIATLPPVAMQMAKRVLQHSMDATLEEQLRFESHGLRISGRATADAAESRAAFRERRPGRFIGR